MLKLTSITDRKARGGGEAGGDWQGGGAVDTTATATATANEPQ